MSGIGFRIILAIFRDCGKTRDGNQQKQRTDAEAKSPVGCDFAEEAFLSLLNIHARMQTTGNFRETPLCAAATLACSFILRLLGFRKQELGCQGVR